MCKSNLRQPFLIVVLVLVLISGLLIVTTVNADPGTAFSYQGQLLDSNGVVDDTCDIQFSLYDAVSGGSQVGVTDTHAATVVTDGLFTVELDFGVNAFNGDPRWIEIATRCPAGSGGYDTLAPRQPLNPTPYSIYATQAMTATHASTATTALNVKQLVQEFVVDAGDNVSTGDVVSFVNGTARRGTSGETVFNAEATQDISVGALSSTQLVIAYRDSSGEGTAIIGTLTGGSISYGSEFVFNAAATSYVRLSVLSSTEFVVAYYDGGNGSYGTAIVGTVSGSDISYSAEFVFNAAATYQLSIATLSSTQFVVAYRDGGNSNYGAAIIGTVSGGAISYGTEEVFRTDAIGSPQVIGLSSTQFVVGYTYSVYDPMMYSYTYYGQLRVGDISGGPIVYGSEAQYFIDYGMGGGGSISAAADLSSSSFVFAYSNMSSLYCMVGTVSGTTISLGSGQYVPSASSTSATLDSLSSASFVLGYAGTNSYGTVRSNTVSGTTITYGIEEVFNYASSSYMSVSAVSGSDYMIAYRDGGNSNFGSAIINQNFGRWQVIGIAQEDAAGGETVPVIIQGVSDIHTGLTPHETYYAFNDGSVVTSVTPHRVGVAISPTSLLLSSNRDNDDQFFADMIFANDFRITEVNDDPEGLIFKNQKGFEIMRLDEAGTLQLQGAIQLKTTTDRPTCDETTRGQMWLDFGETDESDTGEICLKDAGNVYAWRSLMGPTRSEIDEMQNQLDTLDARLKILESLP